MPKLYNDRYFSHKQDRLDAIQRDIPEPPDARCCTGNDPACPMHGIAASNARQNAYWKRVGGHPNAGAVDGPDVERCIWCTVEPVDEAHAPYCSVYCAVQAERS